MRALSLGSAILAACSLGSAQAPPETGQRAFLDRYCVGCHNVKTRTGGLALDAVDLARPAGSAEILEKVDRKLRAGLMPPAGIPRPPKSEQTEFLTSLEKQLDAAAAGAVNPGAPALHRMNRTEYANAVRDLLGLDVDATSLLPADDSSAGFDNNADALGVSPALMERYLSAASKVSRLAIGDTHASYTEKTWAVPNDLSQHSHVEGLPFGTRGGILIRHVFPADGEYKVRVELSRGGAGAFAGSGTMTGEELEIGMNGERARLIPLGSVVPGKAAPLLEATVIARAGEQSIGVTFVAKNDAPSEDILQPYERTMFPGDVWAVLPHIGSVTIMGPSKVTGIGDSQSRRMIFVCRPAGPRNDIPCARRIVSTLARRAYRRPVTESDIATLMGFYATGRARGTFDDGIEIALRRILASPEFMFRFEREPAQPLKAFRITDIELASRLSFFIWSSIPDDELVRVASEGRLRDPIVLEQQVRRMLVDPRSNELVKNFAGQWLYVRNLQNTVPAIEDFPDFDDNLRQAFETETEMFFDSIVRENRSVLDLLTADYTFVNERLARHYGIPNIYGSQFRRIPLSPDSPRRGLLGKGSILTATSLATRTSPVLRGKWVLENILGTPPPEPPPNVPALKENAKPTDRGTETAETPSVRKRLEEHRANPVCAGCHKMMDPIGFSLENFDAVGQWRTVDGSAPVDASGQLVDGTKVDGPAALRESMVGYSEQFLRTVTEKLLIYAIGRGVTYRDMPVVRSVVKTSAPRNYRFSDLILGIVQSAPFQWRARDNAANMAQVSHRENRQ
jgi:cytochrome c551/c552